MKEEILQYAWQYKTFDIDSLFTDKGERVEVIDFGRRNVNAGPDFFNAKVRINGTIWVGNVEIHTLASDWQRHGHHLDVHYDSVILHVVYVNDYQAKRLNGDEIPTVILKIDERMLMCHDTLCNSRVDTRCATYIGELESDFLYLHLSKLLNDRLFAKSQILHKLTEESNGDWEEAFFVLLATTLGLGTNAMPFEQLAKSFRLRDLLKHADDLVQIEAMLFGQAGLLKDEAESEYERLLLREYKLLRSKFSLVPIDSSLWAFAKMRPVNFPHIRIAELAAIVYRSQHLFSKVLDAKDVKVLTKMFMVNTSEFWSTHYTFCESSPQMVKRIGTSTAESIIINAVVPTLFAYAQKRELPEYEEKALVFLETLKPEKNNIITNWAELGIVARSAYESQALIELRKNYCLKNDCLRCGIAHKILTRKCEPQQKSLYPAISTKMADILSKVEREVE